MPICDFFRTYDNGQKAVVTVTLDDGKITGTAEDGFDTLLESILEDSVEGDDGEKIDPAEEPEAWFEALPYQYDNAYLRAEIRDNDERQDASAPPTFDFNFVNSRIAIGNGIGNHQDRVDALKAAGITVVVDCQSEYDDAPLLMENEMAVIDVGVDDDGTPKPKSWFETIIVFTLAALQHPGAKVYFHCFNGHNRAPSACYSVLRALGFSPEAAEKMIRDVRPAVTMRHTKDADAAVAALGYD
jgi:hypothetical protein